MKLGFVLPTRHRAAYAIEAIRSLLAQEDCTFTIVVSDNSSSEEEVAQLRVYCEQTADARLLYIRPPEVLPMPAHWNWALEQALARTDVTHLGIQYDRKVWKPGELRRLAEACAQASGQLVTYMGDFTYPAKTRVGAWRMAVTGRLYEIRTARVVALTTRGMIHEMGQAWPVLSNCMVPRAVFDRVRARFGDICNSSTPDTAFAFRFCAVEERYAHYDRTLVIVYGFNASNALSLFRQERGGTWSDFARLWGDKPWAPAAPIPDLRLGQNVSFHEYNLVQRVAGTERFPPIEREGYLRELARALAHIKDPAEREATRALLRQHGWREEPPQQQRSRPLHRRILSRLRRPFARAEQTFAGDAEAVAWLLANPRPPVAHNAVLEVMEPVVVAFPR